MARYFWKVSFSGAFELTGKTYICSGISAWKMGESIKSTHFCARPRLGVPLRMPTNSICRKHDPSETIAAVGASVRGWVAPITSNGGLEPYETTIGRGPWPADPLKSVL